MQTWNRCLPCHSLNIQQWQYVNLKPMSTTPLTKTSSSGSMQTWNRCLPRHSLNIQQWVCSMQTWNRCLPRHSLNIQQWQFANLKPMSTTPLTKHPAVTVCKLETDVYHATHLTSSSDSMQTWNRCLPRHSLNIQQWPYVNLNRCLPRHSLNIQQWQYVNLKPMSTTPLTKHPAVTVCKLEKDVYHVTH